MILAWLVLLAVMLSLFLVDEAPPDDRDLLVERLKIAEKENGFTVVDCDVKSLGAIKEQGEAHDDDGDPADGLIVFSKTWKRDRAELYVEERASFVRKLEESLQFPRFQVPEVESLSQRMPYLVAWREMGHSLRQRSACRFVDGREKEAFEDALRVIRFGHRIENGDGALISSLVGLTIRSVGLRSCLSLVLRTNLERGEIEPVLVEMERFRTEEAVWRDVFRSEYRLVILGIEGLARGELGEQFDQDSDPPWFVRKLFFKVNKTRRLVSQSFRKLIASLSGDPGGPEEPVYDLEPESKLLALWPFNNALGTTIWRTLMAALTTVPTRLREVRFEENAPRIVLAIREFKKTRGNLPAALDELVPAYLPSVPLDPFDGKPFRYSQEKKVLYSLGSERLDLGPPNLDPEGEDCIDNPPACRIEL